MEGIKHLSHSPLYKACYEKRERIYVYKLRIDFRSLAYKHKEVQYRTWDHCSVERSKVLWNRLWKEAISCSLENIKGSGSLLSKLQGWGYPHWRGLVEYLSCFLSLVLCLSVLFSLSMTLPSRLSFHLLSLPHFSPAIHYSLYQFTRALSLPRNLRPGGNKQIGSLLL